MRRIAAPSARSAGSGSAARWRAAAATRAGRREAPSAYRKWSWCGRPFVVRKDCILCYATETVA
ncbi:hypothetical protein TSO221_00115 [Azospirillum sp. TSO22-1]|nr:hypothetical protein TSO221_00115 [Azospirillum sp. TSO22-1]